MPKKHTGVVGKALIWLEINRMSQVRKNVFLKSLRTIKAMLYYHEFYRYPYRP